MPSQLELHLDLSDTEFDWTDLQYDSLNIDLDLIACLAHGAFHMTYQVYGSYVVFNEVIKCLVI